MSWQEQNTNKATSAIRDLRCRPSVEVCRILCLAWLSGLFCLFPGGLKAQENPLRDGDAGYLQQLLPSLQRIQDESASPPSSAPVGPAIGASEESSPFVGQATPSAFTQADGTTVETNLGAWRPEQTPSNSLPAQPMPDPLIEGTETGLVSPRSSPAWVAATDVSAPPLAGMKSGNEIATKAGGSKLTAPGTSSGPATTKSQGLGKLSAFKGVESLQLDSTMVKIGLNTLLVLAASIALIVVVRKALPKQVTAAAAQRQAGRLKVEQSLSLGGKAELKVIRCGLHQVLVAMDNGGIKSVVALEPALETEREHLEPEPESQPPAPLKEPVNIEQFVKMIRDMDGNLLASRPGR